MEIDNGKHGDSDGGQALTLDTYASLSIQWEFDSSDLP